ncbi:MAG TPA: ERF family protein [bacterium]|nr:ERF family protein [bacterium]HNH30438.1 ERF family protein [bacterium]
MEHSTSIVKLAEALCKFQSQIKAVKKEAENPFYKSKYATLNDDFEVARPYLSENKLSVLQFPSGGVDGIGLTTMILHESGEYISESFTIKPTKADPQSIGSLIKYMRRYALEAALSLTTRDDVEDDDGNAATGKTGASGESAAKQATEAKQQQAASKQQTETPKTFAELSQELIDIDHIDSLVAWWTNNQSNIQALPEPQRSTIVRMKDEKKNMLTAQK